MLEVLSWILTGLVIGAVARLLVPGRQPIGLGLTILLGIGGAIIGGLLSSAIWGPPDFNANPDASRMWPGWMMSLVGAVILLLGYVAVFGPREPTRPLPSR